MAVIDASIGDLTDVNTLLRWVTNELVSNHRFTPRYGDVGGVEAGPTFSSSSDTLRWLDRPQAETFYNDTPLCIGIRNSDDTRGQDSQTIGLGLYVAKALFTTFDPGTGNRWTDNDFVTNATVQQHLPCANGSSPFGLAGACGVDNMETGPFLRARMITNPTSNSATPSEPLYFYVMVEVATGIFRKFGWGEVNKYYPWTGGIFVMGDIYKASTATDFYTGNQALFGSGLFTSSVMPSNNSDEHPFHIYASGWTGVSDTDSANGRGWMAGFSVGNPGGSNEQVEWPALGWDARAGLGIMQTSPSGFSLQSERDPAVIFGGNQKFHDAGGFEIHPMGVFPDVYQAIVSDVDAYGVFQDSAGDKFMVMPHISKLVDADTNSDRGSGRHGILIKNLDLVVTIS